MADDTLETIIREVLEVMMLLYYFLTNGENIFADNAPDVFGIDDGGLRGYACQSILMSNRV